MQRERCVYVCDLLAKWVNAAGPRLQLQWIGVLHDNGLVDDRALAKALAGRGIHTNQKPEKTYQ